MKKYKWFRSLVEKLLVFIGSLFVLSILVFYVARLAPGDPLIAYYGDRVERMSTGERQRVEKRLGLHDSITTQYVRWLEHALSGDFGISYKYKMPVKEVIESRVGNTLILGGIGFLLVFAGALLLGVFCAWHEGRWPDRLVCQVGTVTSAIPEFWLALLLILIFSVELRLLPSSGAYTIGGGDSIADRLRHLILPMAVVVINHLWYYA